MAYDFTTLGAIIGLVVAIVLIIKKVQPAYSLILGALVGGIIGGGDLAVTVNTMVSGASSMMSSVLRIMTSGILMAAATASTTAGTTIASQTFGATLLGQGVAAVSAGAMVHAGATVLDSLPHGSFFHATGGSVNMNINDRMKLIPYEACIGLTSTVLAIIWYLI